jgi:uncharacterized membrane-anchored protein
LNDEHLMDAVDGQVAEEVADEEAQDAVAIEPHLRWSIGQVTLWQWGLVAMVAAYTAYFTKVSLDVHHGL